MNYSAFLTNFLCGNLKTETICEVIANVGTASVVL
jgi:hypothetical protein